MITPPFVGRRTKKPDGTSTTGERCRTATLLTLIGLCGSAFAQSNGDNTVAVLSVIKTTAADICTAVPTEGSGADIDLTGTAKAKVDGLVDKVTSLGIEGAGRFQEKRYKGVLQKDLAQAISAQNNCKLAVFNTLVDRMIPRIPDSPQPTGAPPSQPAPESLLKDTRIAISCYSSYCSSALSWKQKLTLLGANVSIFPSPEKFQTKILFRCHIPSGPNIAGGDTDCWSAEIVDAHTVYYGQDRDTEAALTLQQLDPRFRTIQNGGRILIGLPFDLLIQLTAE
jgi:hypothetical protein